jgi:ABC-type sugar transport system permease subunit
MWSRFRHVTIPGIRNTLVVLFILESMWGLREFDLVYGMTQGGPGHKTSILGWLVYELGFRTMRVSEASTVAWILFVVTYVLTFLYLVVFYRRE